MHQQNFLVMPFRQEPKGFLLAPQKKNHPLTNLRKQLSPAGTNSGSPGPVIAIGNSGPGQNGVNVNRRRQAFAMKNYLCFRRNRAALE
jgi:hypothetical protein